MSDKETGPEARAVGNALASYRRAFGWQALYALLKGLISRMENEHKIFGVKS